MTRDKLESYIAEQYGAEAEYLFKRYPDTSVFRRPDNRKWFALMNYLPYQTLGITKEGSTHVLNVKLDPLMVASLRKRRGFCPAWHMHKEHWITILLDGSVDAEEIYTFIDMSFRSVAGR
ncbi:MAG: MmcQ/YjbR family DNA-binding protein [Atopobiaceae bacterium]|nr:MmcQ/YjbR family DNA-binding protein [Atopobiaceae bacterium]